MSMLFRSLLATHAPYWVAAVLVAVTVRRVRRSLEAVADDLRAGRWAL